MNTIQRRKLGLTYIDSELTVGGFTLYAGQTAGGRVDLIDIRGKKVHEIGRASCRERV